MTNKKYARNFRHHSNLPARRHDRQVFGFYFAQKFNPSVTPLNNGDHGGPDAVDTDPVSGYGASFSHNDRRYDENNIEVIVVNDGSTDETEEILKPYRDKIIYKAIPNSGAPKARNVGFELSKGRFVIFCDADLILKPEMLQTLYDKLKNNPDATYAYAVFVSAWVDSSP